MLTLSGVGLLLAVGLAAYLLVFSDWPGGMRPTYAAADYDARLTREAANAMPLIAALNRYHDEHAGFPAHAADFISYLVSVSPRPLTASTDDMLGWRYAQGEKGVSYILSRKLGWDASLRYHYDASGTRWVFDPGDGSPERTIILKP
jgi:hypothetical protein